MTYQAFYARQFHEQLMELPDSAYDKVEHSIDVLVDNTGLLRDYDPPYDAAMPHTLAMPALRAMRTPRNTWRPVIRRGFARSKSTSSRATILNVI